MLLAPTATIVSAAAITCHYYSINGGGEAIDQIRKLVLYSRAAMGDCSLGPLDLAIVIVNYNTCALLRDCLQSVYASDGRGLTLGRLRGRQRLARRQRAMVRPSSRRCT